MSDTEVVDKVDSSVPDSLDDGVEVEYDASTLDYFVKSRKKELGLIEEPTPEEPPVETPALESESPPESYEKFKELIAEEKRQREERKAIEEERKTLFEEKRELELFREAKRKFGKDPEGLFKALGMSDEAIQEFAKMVMYKSLGEDAPEDFKNTQRQWELEREIERLKAEKEEEPEETVDYEAVRNAYVSQLNEAAENVDASKYPGVAKFAETRGMEQVVKAMFGYAQKNAIELKGEGEALTPEECLDRFEKDLNELVNSLAPKSAPEQKKKTLRNQTVSPPSKTYEQMTPQEQDAYRKRRFKEVLFRNQKG